MADKELEFWGEVGAPAWVATAKLGVKWKRTWSDRRREYSDQVVEESGLDRDALVDELEGDERRSDLFVAGLGRAGEVGDPEYRSALARLVGAAFHDEAAIEEIDYLTAQVIKLEPLHLRVLQRAVQRDEGRVLVMKRDGLPRVHGIHLSRAAEAAGVSLALARAALDRLIADGFVQLDPTVTARDRRDADRAVEKGFSAPFRLPRYKVTDWGRQALGLCLDLEHDD